MRTVVFIAGAILMSLEMLGSRVLAPYFGNSIFVWGSLISVFLASLSVGYVVGGRVADKYPDRRMLALSLFAPGVLTVVLPWISSPVNNYFSTAGLDVRLGPLMASFILFFAPGVFLGMVSPFAIKLQVKGLDTVGNTAGSLYAVSTLGSIVGTLGTSFFLITWLGVRLIVHLLGILLIVLAAAVAVSTRKAGAGDLAHTAKKSARAKNAGKTLALLLTLTAAGFVGAGGADAAVSKTLYEKDSLYHHITVVDEAGLRYLKFDASWQSAMYLDDPLKLNFEYTEFFHLGPLLRPDSKSALFIGLGGGSVPKNFHANYPGLVMDVAEIDPEVINVAKKYFAVKEDSRLRLHAKDGRIFVKQSKNVYDMVFLDAYYADAIPFHLATQEYMKELSARMAPDGIIVSNVISAVGGPDSRLFRSMYKTFQSVFPKVYAFPVGRLQGSTYDQAVQNIVLVGFKQNKEPDWAEAKARAKSMTANLKVPSDLSAILACRVTKPITITDVPLLTDDYAPVDSLLHW